MEPALDVLNRALLGDPSSRSFLERTTSIYLLDVTDVSKPKTYGCWNFIHQAMNEVERYEAAYMRSDQAHKMLNGAGLVHHVRLLASMALRVARRSPASDKKLVMTCIANSERFDGTESQSQWLIDLNLELREIVMGRIAAMAFDFTFHRRVGELGYSAYSDGVVRDTLCAVLSANAVATGPGAIRHFSTEWIIPSSRNLPAFALASVVLHLALEGSRRTAPVGSKDILQELSVQVMSVVLVPLLADSINESNGIDTTIAMCFRAITSWCTASDLSLPQIRHVCSKVQIDIVTVLNDAMYSDSPAVVDALAHFVETLVGDAVDNPIPSDRMNQVRHIIQVDESSFQARFSLDQLKVIESKEMEAIVSEIVSAVGLQRFRFTERQRSGDHDVCRNLARIAASMCKTCCAAPEIGWNVRPDPGVIELLLKAASHPIVHVSAIALDGLLDASRRGYASAVSLLPVLQRRAIIPHLFTDSGELSLAADEQCGVTFQEFESFRDGVLTDFLLLCWQLDPENFMDSCTAAIEEFCFAEQVSPELSLQLEAALFCVEVVAREASREASMPHAEHMNRIVSAVGSKPLVIFSNPLTLSRMCYLLQQLSPWLVSQGLASGATGLAVEAFRSGLSASPRSSAHELVNESGVSVVSSAIRALKGLCVASPGDLANDACLHLLGDAWKESCQHSSTAITVDDRRDFLLGISTVILALPPDSQTPAFSSMVSTLLDSLESHVSVVKASDGTPSFQSELSKLSSVVSVIATLPRMTQAEWSHSNSLVQNAPLCDLTKLPQSITASLGRSWPLLRLICQSYSNNDDIVSSVTDLLSQWLPNPVLDENSRLLVDNIMSLAVEVATNGRDKANFQPIFLFLEAFVHKYGERIEKIAIADNTVTAEKDDLDFNRMFRDVVTQALDGARIHLGNAWSRPKEQLQGQQAFESKPNPFHVESAPNESSLGGVFSFTNRCLDSCPYCLLRLPAGATPERSEDLLIARAIESSVIALNDSDPDIVRTAMKLLQTAVLKRPLYRNEMQTFLSDLIARYCTEIFSRLLLGFCGNFKRDLIAGATGLLAVILQESVVPDAEAHLVAALRREYFLLGNEAKNAMLSVCGRLAQKEITSTTAVAFFETVWELHQVEDTEALPNSESVARLVAQFSV